MKVINKRTNKVEEIENVFIIGGELRIIFDDVEYDATKQYEEVK